MDAEQTVEVGTFCELVLTNNSFNTLWSEFEKATAHNLLSTKPEQTKQREEIYATFNGACMFLTFMKTIVDEARLLAHPPDDEDDIDLIEDMN